MGSWGFGSDENDNTYDFAGLDVFDRLKGAPGLSEEGQNNIWNDIKDDNLPLGYIIMLIKAGAIIPKSVIIDTINNLKSKEKIMDKYVYEYEMMLCNEALEYGSFKKPVQIFGIAHYGDFKIKNEDNIYKFLVDERKKDNMIKTQN